MATSTIKGGITEFIGTLGSMSGGDCLGKYDRASGLVRINIQWRNSSDTSASTALFTIPSEYRPSVAKGGTGMVVLSSGTIASSYLLGTNGAITQRATNSARGGFAYFEYTL